MRGFFTAALVLLLILIIPLSVFAENYSCDGIISEAIGDADAICASIAQKPCESVWYAIALSQYGEYDLTQYEAALCESIEGSISDLSPVTKQKYALVLAAVGSNNAIISELADGTAGGGGLMSYVFALHLGTNGYGNADTDSLIDKLLSLKKSDGGWAVTPGASDVDATAMTLTALAPYASDPDVSEAILDALSFLSESQNEDGSFSSFGDKSSESCSQVIIALCSLGINPDGDTRFIKNEKTVTDALLSYKAEGGFSHTASSGASEIATEQAFLAFVAISRFNKGLQPVFILDRASPDKLEAPIDKHEPSGKSDADGIKAAIAISAGAAALIISAVALILKRKKALGTVIGVLSAAAVIITAVLFIEIKTPDAYYADTEKKENPIGTVMLSISCDTVAKELDDFKDGVILAPTELDIEEGESVYDILVEAARANRIALDAGSESLAYVRGIAHIYEFDFGNLSGWVFFVNGERSSVGAGDVILKDGDVVEWHYTKNLGDDVQPK